MHAQAETETVFHKAMAQRGAYVELDSVGASDPEDAKILQLIQVLKDAGFEDRILISQDAGWYNPGQPQGGKKRGYNSLITLFLPRLKAAGHDEAFIHKLTRENPFRAFAVDLKQ